jgi:hypothetical protein
MRMSGQRHATAVLYPRYQLDRRLGGPQLVWTQTNGITIGIEYCLSCHEIVFYTLDLLLISCFIFGQLKVVAGYNDKSKYNFPFLRILVFMESTCQCPYQKSCQNNFVYVYMLLHSYFLLNFCITTLELGGIYNMHGET